MLAATYGNVSDIEIIWILIGAVGVLFSAFNLRDAWLDRAAILRAGIYNGRRTIANFAVRGEAARFAIQSIFVTIGVLAAFLSDPPEDALTTFQVVSHAMATVGLVIAEILVLFKSIDSFIVRHSLRTQNSRRDLNE